MKVGAYFLVSRMVRFADMHERGSYRQSLQGAERIVYGALTQDAKERVAGGVTDSAIDIRIIIMSFNNETHAFSAPDTNNRQAVKKMYNRCLVIFGTKMRHRAMK